MHATIKGRTLSYGSSRVKAVYTPPKDRFGLAKTEIRRIDERFYRGLGIKKALKMQSKK